jgi:O-antigen/teichoic acid export membrane protein
VKEPLSDPTSLIAAGQLKSACEVSGGAFDLHRFGSDVLVYALGRGLLLVFGFVQVLIIPRYLSVEGYGYWQLFVLYASYAGILHLGFIDGILARWAGKDLAPVSSEIRIAFRFLLLEQLIVIPPLALLLYFLLHPPFQWIALMIVAYTFITNLATLFTFTACLPLLDRPQEPVLSAP